MDPALEQDEIRLTVPAQPAFARVARQAAGGLAARLAFSYDQLDEVRLAISEAWTVLLGDRDRSGTVAMAMTVLGPGAVAVELVLEPAGPHSSAAPSGRTGPAEAVLAMVAAEVEISPDGSRIHLVLRAG